MERRDYVLLVVVLLVAALTVFVDLNIEHPEWFENLQFWRPEGFRDIVVHQGLDLQGGLQVLLAADIADEEEVDAAAMETARQIIENRVNGLGLTEPVVQQQGERRIIVELPGVEDPEQAVQTIQGTALLEFIDAGSAPLPAGTLVYTTEGPPPAGQVEQPVIVPDAPPTPEDPLLFGPSETEDLTNTQVYETILTGAALEEVGLNRSETNEYEIPFQLYPDAAQVFASYTAAHVGQYLCIVLDKRVISCPTIQQAIPDGAGRITLGGASYDDARNLAIQLHYGALPIPLRLETVNTVGPTLGEISVERSIRAGMIGLSVVLFFMLIYYRLPGALADVALVLYALLNLALYKLAPVTLTLPGIAGFLLSAGMAVDANILVFERMKEELRAGRSLRASIESGFGRAWTSIRDSQVSTLIVCGVLYFFGSNFGASMVKGFALTLAIGTVINIFTAVFATRTLIRLVFYLAGDWLRARRWLLGV
ncbi:MAG: protein translocase subunit SecD [Anaerolineae bacterium]|nr:protein translocase subunit SecD [Anaerolineae bacterium]